jgi:hypothetical protein
MSASDEEDTGRISSEQFTGLAVCSCELCGVERLSPLDGNLSIMYNNYVREALSGALKLLLMAGIEVPL